MPTGGSNKYPFKTVGKASEEKPLLTRTHLDESRRREGHVHLCVYVGTTVI